MAVEDYQQGAKVLDDKLRRLSDFQDLLSGGTPSWYGRLLSGLLLVTNSDEPLYVSGSYAESEDLESFSAQVVVFTRDIVAHTKLSGPVLADIDTDVFVSVSPRRSLTRFHVAAGEEALTEEARASWPGRVHLKVIFPGLELSLPMGITDSRSHDTELLRLIDGLRGDLIARGE